MKNLAYFMYYGSFATIRYRFPLKLSLFNIYVYISRAHLNLAKRLSQQAINVSLEVSADADEGYA